MLLSVIATGLLMLAPDQAAQPVSATPAATAQAAAGVDPAADPNRRICKRSTPTGSMIASRRECRTAAEWTRLAEAAQAHADNVVERGRQGGLASSN